MLRPKTTTCPGLRRSATPSKMRTTASTRRCNSAASARDASRALSGPPEIEVEAREHDRGRLARKWIHVHAQCADAPVAEEVRQSRQRCQRAPGDAGATSQAPATAQNGPRVLRK
jgi:hypothetical protein